MSGRADASKGDSCSVAQPTRPAVNIGNSIPTAVDRRGPLRLSRCRGAWRFRGLKGPLASLENRIAIENKTHASMAPLPLRFSSFRFTGLSEKCADNIAAWPADSDFNVD